MTACVNRKHSRRAAAVISASLVGALSLGVAPVAAMANEGIEVLTATEVDQVEQATVTAAKDNAGNPVNPTTVKQFAWDGYAHFVIPTKIDNAQVADWPASGLDVNADNGVNVVYMKVNPSAAGNEYVDNNKVEWVSNGQPTAAGTYYAVVKADGETDGVNGNNAWVKFEIVDRTIEDAYVCQGGNVKDKTIEYNGQTLSFGTHADTKCDLDIVIDGKATDLAADFTNYKLYKADDASKQSLTNVEHAGTYVIEGTYTANGKFYSVEFEVKPIDLATADIAFRNGSALYAKVGGANDQLPDFVSSLNDNALTQVPAKTNTSTIGTIVTPREDTTVELQYTGKHVDDMANPAKGAYTYKVKAYQTSDSDKASTDVVNEADVTVVRYQNEGKIRYNKATLTGGDETLGAFNPDLIDAVKPDGTKLPVKVTYTRDGEPTEDITAPGDYEATIVIDDSTYEWGSKATLEFHVAATRVDVDEIYATYKGETLKTASVRDIYSGDDLMANLSVTAIDEDDKEVPADQIILTITDAEGEEVDSVVEAGTYTITIGTVEGSVYEIKGGTDELTFTVDPVRATDDKDANAQLRLTGTMGFGPQAATAYIYTGEAVVPGFEYDLTANMWDYDLVEDWKALPTETYKVSYQMQNEKTKKWEDVEECVQPGSYRALLADAESADSYIVDVVVPFTISDQRVFHDVPNDFWGAESIYNAAYNKWMTGYGYTNFFGPNDNIKRGDVAVVLYKMAGMPEFVDEGQYDETTGFKTGFGDVDGKMYYAEAILWAKQAGIVSGDEGTNSFRPEDSISRQELAKMLAVYAEKCGEDVSTDVDAVLGEYEDANTVSEWAEGYVAYLVEAEIMGNESPLRGTDPITRAEVATMVVRLSDTVDFDNIMF